MNKELILKAKAFAESVHAGQFRKHGNRPYVYHPGRVASYLEEKGYYDKLIAAAWLHDTLEDCPGVTYNTLEVEFGTYVAGLVKEVSHLETPVYLKRKYRWKIYLQHYSNASHAGMVLKLADRVCNLQEYVDYWEDVPSRDRRFLFDVYLEESTDLLEVLFRADYRIACNLRNLIDHLDELCSKED